MYKLLLIPHLVLGTMCRTICRTVCRTVCNNYTVVHILSFTLRLSVCKFQVWLPDSGLALAMAGPAGHEQNAAWQSARIAYIQILQMPKVHLASVCSTCNLSKYAPRESCFSRLIQPWPADWKGWSGMPGALWRRLNCMAMD